MTVSGSSRDWQLIVPCMLRVAGFNERRMGEWAAAQRGLPSAVESEIIAFPNTEAECLAFAQVMRP